jgi:hypothetical protein
MIRISFFFPQHLLRAVGADDGGFLSIPNAQGTPGTFAILDAPAHAAVNQKQQSVTLEEAALFSVSSIRELHLAGLVALNQMPDT